jgi:hypothetical protein
VSQGKLRTRGGKTGSRGRLLGIHKTVRADQFALLPLEPQGLIRQQDWPNPPRRRQSGFTEVSTNLLLTTLNAQAQAFPPGREQDWPNPVLRRRTVSVTYHRASFDPQPPIVPPPFAQLDWPLPSRRAGALPPPPQAVNTLLLSARPHAQLDWPLPVRRAPHRLDGSQGRVVDSIPAIFPAGQTWQELPPRRAVRLPTDVAPNLLLTTLSAQAQAFPPGREQHWPNPVLRRRTVSVTYHRASFDPQPPIVPPPFAQLDWPLPLRRNWLTGQQFEHVRYFARPDDALLLAPQRDWPLPVRRRPTQQNEQYPNLVLRVVAERPFAQLDWPLPQRRRPVAQPQAQASLLTTTLFVPPQAFPPGREQHWPLPQRRPYRDWTIAFSGTPLPNAIPGDAGFPVFTGPIPDQNWVRFDTIDVIPGNTYFSDVRTFELGGAWPRGISIDLRRGTISGTPQELGTFTGLTVRATNNFGTRISNAFSVTITAQTNPDESGQLYGPRRIRAMGLKAFSRKRS